MPSTRPASKKAPAKKAAPAKAVPKKAEASGRSAPEKGQTKKPASNPKAPAKKAGSANRTPAKKAAPAAKGGTSTTAPARKAPAKYAASKEAAPEKAVIKKAPPKKAAPKKAAPKKAAPKKDTAPAPARPAAPKRSPYGAKFVAQQEKALREERQTYTRQFTNLRAEAAALVADFESGDVQFDEESGEGDTINIERERDLALSEQARQAIEEIDRALVKIGEGTYGICEVSGEPIPAERLEAIPWARERVEFKTGGLSRR